MRKLDLTGQKFGHLTVLRPAENVGTRTAWRCRCDCGNAIVVTTARLRAGQTKSCGQPMCPYANSRMDLTGQRYGHLTVLEPAENVGPGTTWRCRCDCGNETVVMTHGLRSGNTKSCGRPGCICFGNRMDLTGQSYGYLTVLRPAGNIAGHTAWTCRCECGRETVAKADTLRSGRARSCGHPDCPWSVKGRLRDLADRRYGSLTVLRQAEDIDGRPACLCRCDCGEETVVRAADLRNSRVRSCGCAGRGSGPASG